MIPSLSARLARLEAEQTPPGALETSFSPALRLLRLLIAVHLGGLEEHEPVAVGLARALGYGTVMEMRSAMVANREIVLDWGGRHNEEMGRLLAGAQGIPEIHSALVNLYEGLPAWTRAHAFAADPDFDTAAEWVAL